MKTATRRQAQQDGQAVWLGRIIRRLDDSTDAQAIRLIENARLVLAECGSSFTRLGDEIARSFKLRSTIAPELDDGAPFNPTICRLILERHRIAIGLPGELVLSAIVDRLENGGATNADRASFRNVQARARLAMASSR